VSRDPYLGSGALDAGRSTHGHAPTAKQANKHQNASCSPSHQEGTSSPSQAGPEARRHAGSASLETSQCTVAAPCAARPPTCASATEEDSHAASPSLHTAWCPDIQGSGHSIELEGFTPGTDVATGTGATLDPLDVQEMPAAAEYKGSTLDPQDKASGSPRGSADSDSLSSIGVADSRASGVAHHGSCLQEVPISDGSNRAYLGNCLEEAREIVPWVHGEKRSPEHSGVCTSDVRAELRQGLAVQPIALGTHAHKGPVAPSEELLATLAPVAMAQSSHTGNMADAPDGLFLEAAPVPAVEELPEASMPIQARTDLPSAGASPGFRGHEKQAEGGPQVLCADPRSSKDNMPCTGASPGCREHEEQAEDGPKVLCADPRSGKDNMPCTGASPGCREHEVQPKDGPKVMTLDTMLGIEPVTTAGASSTLQDLHAEVVAGGHAAGLVGRATPVERTSSPGPAPECSQPPTELPVTNADVEVPVVVASAAGARGGDERAVKQPSRLTKEEQQEHEEHHEHQECQRPPLPNQGDSSDSNAVSHSPAQEFGNTDVPSASIVSGGKAPDGMYHSDKFGKHESTGSGAGSEHAGTDDVNSEAPARGMAGEAALPFPPSRHPPAPVQGAASRTVPQLAETEAPLQPATLSLLTSKKPPPGWEVPTMRQSKLPEQATSTSKLPEPPSPLLSSAVQAVSSELDSLLHSLCLWHGMPHMLCPSSPQQRALAVSPPPGQPSIVATSFSQKPEQPLSHVPPALVASPPPSSPPPAGTTAGSSLSEQPLWPCSMQPVPPCEFRTAAGSMQVLFSCTAEHQHFVLTMPTPCPVGRAGPVEGSHLSPHRRTAINPWAQVTYTASQDAGAASVQASVQLASPMPAEGVPRLARAAPGAALVPTADDAHGLTSPDSTVGNPSQPPLVESSAVYLPRQPPFSLAEQSGMHGCTTCADSPSPVSTLRQKASAGPPPQELDSPPVHTQDVSHLTPPRVSLAESEPPAKAMRGAINGKNVTQEDCAAEVGVSGARLLSILCMAPPEQDVAAATPPNAARDSAPCNSSGKPLSGNGVKPSNVSVQDLLVHPVQRIKEQSSDPAMGPWQQNHDEHNVDDDSNLLLMQPLLMANSPLEMRRGHQSELLEPHAAPHAARIPMEAARADTCVAAVTPNSTACPASPPATSNLFACLVRPSLARHTLGPGFLVWPCPCVGIPMVAARSLATLTSHHCCVFCEFTTTIAGFPGLFVGDESQQIADWYPKCAALARIFRIGAGTMLSWRRATINGSTRLIRPGYVKFFLSFYVAISWPAISW
jgi:hypothetical protein